MSDYVLAAIDRSPFAEGVCEYAAWAAKALDASLTFIHVVEHHTQAVRPDLAGNLGLGTREHLLEELANVDEQRAKIAREQGRLLLEAAKTRAEKAGVAELESVQRNGTLIETLADQEQALRLLVIGKRGETTHLANGHVGANLERVAREMHRPILMVPREFTLPQKVMMAFDGSATAHKSIEMVAKSPLFKGLECHVVLVGTETAENRLQLAWALKALRDEQHIVKGAIHAGDVEETLRHYQQDHKIDMLVMGAYGHSRIRRLLLGSTTTTMLCKTQVPVLILR